MLARALATILAVSSIATPLHAASVIEEVLVTAQKREQNLQDVPMAITALGEQALKNFQVTDITDVQGVSANVQISESRDLLGSRVNATIRGIGNTADIEAGVGIYFDNIYLPSLAGSMLTLLDVQRIEILKGPQGTLYGRNTIGGAIRFITKTPPEELSAKLSYGEGSHGFETISAALAGPLLTGLTGSIALASRESDGFQRNQRNERFASEDRLMGRIELAYDWSDSLSFRLQGFQDGDEGRQYQTIALKQPPVERAVDENADSPPYQEPEDPDQVENSELDYDAYRLKNTILAITTDWQITDSLGLKLTTSLQKTIIEEVRDLDGHRDALLHLLTADNDERYLQHELLANWSLEHSDLVGGVTNFKEEKNQDAVVKARIAAFLLGGSLPEESTDLDLTTVRQDGHQISEFETDGIGAFINWDWYITESLTATVGYRYSHELRAFEQPENRINVADTTTNTHYTDENNPVSVEDNFYNSSGRMALAWNVTDELMVYGSASTGWKAGGFAARASTVAITFEAEEVLSFALGLKADLFDNTVRLSLETFHSEYENKQIPVQGMKRTTPEQGFFFVHSGIDNIDESSIYGAEIELSAITPISGLAVTLNAGYLQAEVQKYLVEVSNDGTIVETTGTTTTDRADRFELSAAPQWTATLGLTYEFLVGEWFRTRIATNYAWRRESFTNSTWNRYDKGIADLIQEDHGILNAGLYFEDLQERWSLSLEGKNLTDERVITTTGDAVTLINGGYNNPESFVATLNFQY